jgi:hypothetical protein
MKKEIFEKITILITTAFGLVAALAWNEAIKTLFTKVFGSAGTIIALFLYAIVVTIIAVWVTIRISSVSEKAINFTENVTSSVKTSVKKVSKK